MKWKKKKVLKKCRKFKMNGQCYAKEENIFIFNLTFDDYCSLYGAGKEI